MDLALHPRALVSLQHCCKKAAKNETGSLTLVDSDGVCEIVRAVAASLGCSKAPPQRRVVDFLTAGDGKMFRDDQFNNFFRVEVIPCILDELNLLQLTYDQWTAVHHWLSTVAHVHAMDVDAALPAPNSDNPGLSSVREGRQCLRPKCIRSDSRAADSLDSDLDSTASHSVASESLSAPSASGRSGAGSVLADRTNKEKIIQEQEKEISALKLMLKSSQENLMKKTTKLNNCKKRSKDRINFVPN